MTHLGDMTTNVSSSVWYIRIQHLLFCEYNKTRLYRAAWGLKNVPYIQQFAIIIRVNLHTKHAFGDLN